MKILVVSEVFYPENFIINDLSSEWLKMGHSVEVLSQYPSYPQSYVYDGYENSGYRVEDWNGIKIHRFPFVEGYRDSKIKKISNYYSFVKGGKKIIREIVKDFDCVFVSQTGPLTVALPAIEAGKKYGIPVAIWTQDIWPDAVYSYGIPRNIISSYFLDRFIKKVYNACDVIFISSKRFSDTISRYVNKECIYTPNWLIPAPEKESALRLDKDRFHFTFTGNVSMYQNLDNVIKGFARAGLVGCDLNIVGDGSYLDNVKELVEKEGVKNVYFHGRYPYEQMNDILLQSDALVLPLIPNEGIMKTEPFKIQSYLNAGKPIFGVLAGSGQDIIDENNIGLCSTPDDIDDIARGFKEMVSYSRKNEMSVKEASKRLMETRFNKSIIIRDFIKHIESIVKK
ncbi:MAG: glycosyltransferase family 4 protein [Flavobacteriales bacterium]|nr:glycosyltransferase family 4 protein [Flavobacteriales bacterium]